MTARPLPTLALLVILALLPALSPALAETNTYGDEITVLDSENVGGTDNLQFAPMLSSDLPLGDTTNELAPEQAETAANGNLWQRIRNGYAMPELKSTSTSSHESWYASRPEYVKRMMGRSQKYLYHIVEEVEKRGMPSEIALLPMVESAFNPQAYSRSRASGIWQFIPSTGKNFGLKQNWWVDNRRDVTAATDAALTYLQKLHVMFGSWDLALAAYNAGEGTVMRAIERNRKKGLPTDYQSLDLPPETRNYVPKLQAVKNIVSNPEQYGLQIQPIDNKPYFTSVRAPGQIDAHLAAKLAGISFDEFIALNPEYNRPVLTAGSTGNHEILLPVGADAVFTENLANYDKPLVSWQTYQAKRGERQTAIAQKFGISLSQLRDVNDLPARSKLNTPRQLLVPKQGGNDSQALAVAEMETTPSAETAAEAKAEPVRRHVVARGDTLSSIAKRHGLTTRQLMAYNHLKSRKLKLGQSLTLKGDAPAAYAKAEKPRPAKSTAGKMRYVVRRGDTLKGIARKFDVAINDIRRWNNLRGSRITPGDKLTILRSDAA